MNSQACKSEHMDVANRKVKPQPLSIQVVHGAAVKAPYFLLLLVLSSAFNPSA